MQAIADPGRIGFDAGRLKNIDSWMHRYVDEEKFAGSSVLVARNGEIAHLSSCGKRSLADDLPFEIDTLVRIYSMTKPMTSLAVMMLHEQGLFNLDAPIDAYLPEFSDCHALIAGAKSLEQCEPSSTPTIHQLLTHTSGLTYGFNPGLLASGYLENEIDFYSDAGGHRQMAEKVAQMPLAFQPGTSWEYSVGIDILGVLVEEISGKQLDEFFQEYIIGPLGLEDTGFGVSKSQQSRFADCFEYSVDTSLKLRDSAKDSIFHKDRVDTLSGGGGLVSTLADYYKFTELLRLGGSKDGVRFISPRTLNFMRRNHLPGDISSMGPKSFAEQPMEGMGFGIGGSIVLDPARTRTLGSVGDYSWGGLASTFFWLDPVEQLSVIFFTQLIPSSTYACRAELKALVHAALTD
jgi:CubicO group peptidase (beta-lactamase class C family)